MKREHITIHALTGALKEQLEVTNSLTELVAALNEEKAVNLVSVDSVLEKESKLTDRIKELESKISIAATVNNGFRRTIKEREAGADSYRKLYKGARRALFDGAYLHRDGQPIVATPGNVTHKDVIDRIKILRGVRKELEESAKSIKRYIKSNHMLSGQVEDLKESNGGLEHILSEIEKCCDESGVNMTNIDTIEDKVAALVVDRIRQIDAFFQLDMAAKILESENERSSAKASKLNAEKLAFMKIVRETVGAGKKMNVINDKYKKWIDKKYDTNTKKD